MRISWLLLASALLSCSVTDEPNNPPVDTAPPVIQELTFVLDSALKQATLRFIGFDPDGPVLLYCGSPFNLAATDSLIITRPFAELRFFEKPDIVVGCSAQQADSVTYGVTRTGIPHAMDRSPQISPAPPPTFYAGTPTSWPHTFTDDWGLTTIHLYISADPTITCPVPALVDVEATVTGLRLDTTLLITLPAPGKYCVIVGTSDDAGHNVGRLDWIEALPPSNYRMKLTSSAVGLLGG